MTRIYSALLLLYPREYREFFGNEMAGVFDDALRDQRAAGSWAYAVFLFSELSGLICGAAIARHEAGPPLRKRSILGVLVGAIALPPVVLNLIRVVQFVAGAHAPTTDEFTELFVIAIISFVIVSLCAVAFAANLRIIARKRGQCSRFAE